MFIPDSSPHTPPTRARRAFETLRGPLFSLSMMAFLEVNSYAPWAEWMPTPISVLSVCVVYAVFCSGFAVGLISAALACLYHAHYLLANGRFDKDPLDASLRVLSWVIVYPIMMAFIAKLKSTANEQAREEADVEMSGYKNRAELMLENANVLVFACDREGLITFYGGGGMEALGTSKESRIGLSIRELYRGQPHVGEAFDRALAGEKQKIILRREPFWMDCSMSPLRDREGRITGIVGAAVDVTARIESEAAKSELEAERRAKAAITTSESKFRGAFDSSPIGIGLILPDMRWFDVNPAFCQMLGYTREEFLTKSVSELTKPGDPVLSVGHYSETLERGERVSYEKRYIHKNGSYVPVVINLGLIRDADGRPQYYLAQAINMTDQRRRELELREANDALRAATRAKSEFLANVSHEIRTPLNGVIGMAGLLLDTNLAETQRSYAETIRASADTLLTLINDLLDFSKIEAGKMELENIDFSVPEMIANIDRVMRFPAEKKGLTFQCSCPTDVGATRLNGDPTRLGQILTNLVSNAIKFTGSGSVVVQVKSMGLSEGRARLRFEVKDSGIGISEEAISRMFKAFSQADASTTRKYGGTGLGLSICKRLVESMNGDIGVTSEAGVGSTFWFTVALPLAADQETKVVPIAAPVAKPRSGRGVRVLLAEDNPVNQLIATKILEKYGFRVDAVGNGIEAIQALEQVPYDVVLMDCQMPEMDGFDATKALRGNQNPRLSEIPIIAMTANAMKGDREACLAAGMNDYVSKPVKAEELVDALFRALPAPAQLAS